MIQFYEDAVTFNGDQVASLNDGVAYVDASLEGAANAEMDLEDVRALAAALPDIRRQIRARGFTIEEDAPGVDTVSTLATAYKRWWDAIYG